MFLPIFGIAPTKGSFITILRKKDKMPVKNTTVTEIQFNYLLWSLIYMANINCSI